MCHNSETKSLNIVKISQDLRSEREKLSKRFQNWNYEKHIIDIQALCSSKYLT